jgi:succinate dehydrogenase / fumarate reductase cytochrome b subunit
LLKKVVILYCVLYFLGNLAIPGAILTGMVKPAAGTVAYKNLVENVPLEQLRAPAATVTQR